MTNESVVLDSSIAALAEEIGGKHGDAARERAIRGMEQVASLWRESD